MFKNVIKFNFVPKCVFLIVHIFSKWYFTEDVIIMRFNLITRISITFL
jgi:hypothetical protein